MKKHERIRNAQKIVNMARDFLEALQAERERIDKAINREMRRSFKWQARILEIEREE